MPWPVMYVLFLIVILGAAVMMGGFPALTNILVLVFSAGMAGAIPMYFKWFA